jgi:hypothetical protein
MFRNRFTQLFEKRAALREKLNRANKAAVRKARKRLEVEQLACRTLPAGHTLLWVGNGNNNTWQVAANWADIDNGGQQTHPDGRHPLI